MGFIIYDIIFLILFATFMSVFLYTRKRNLKREGLLLLYKAEWGIKLINFLGKKYKRTLKFLGYISIATGYLLMAGMIYLFYTIIKIYFFSPEIVRAIKIPPIMPLIPYLPELFKLDFLPPFYFLYWIVIIAIIAIPHELAHGIYSAFSKVEIKKTGFGFFPYFLPIFLAAFVEPDEKQMEKTTRFNQMAILSAGTFANILTALFFLIIFWIFFSLFFVSGGVLFDGYANTMINVSDISKINGVDWETKNYDNLLDMLDEDLSEISTNGKKYLINRDLLESEGNKKLFEEYGLIFLYFDSPMLRQEVKGAIYEINGVEVTNRESLVNEIINKNPREKINIKVFDGENHNEYIIELGEHPEDNEKPWLGVGFSEIPSRGFMGRVMNFISFFKEPNVYYYPKSNLVLFIYNLLWWIILICFSVALINMLPIGIFDGGKFFYLTIASITGSEKAAQRAFSYLTYFFLFLLILLMVFWFRGII